MVGGGAERVVLNLVNELSDKYNFQVDLVLSEAKGQYLEDVSEKVKIVNLDNKRTLFSFFGLKKYLKDESPEILISSITHANIVAILSNALLKNKTKVVISQHNMLSNSLKQSNKMFSYIIYILAKFLYPKADRIIAVSKNIKEDLISSFKINSDNIHIIHNPIMHEAITKQALEPINHEWYKKRSSSIVLAVGRLEVVKDYPTLINSFKLLREKLEVKLLILGEGIVKDELQTLIYDLGLEKDVQLIGFVNNPYKYMRNSDLVVLSSIYEGFGNVLVEALGCGTSVISTNCPGGVSEILDNGKYGTLVPVGDAKSLSEAMYEVLSNGDTNLISRNKERANAFSIHNIVKKYISLFQSF